MLADFVIRIHSDPPRDVQVKVHENVSALRSAATQYDYSNNPNKRKRREAHKDLLGVCHRFANRKKDGTPYPLVAIVRLAPPNLGVGIISHELAHAAVWLWEIENDHQNVPLTCENDEQFCWNLGELVRQTVNMLYKKGIFDDDDNRDPAEPVDS
jgi:hypothetical protein